MTTEEKSAEHRGKHTIAVAGTDLEFRPIEIDTKSPTGGQIAKAAGFSAGQHPYVLQWRPDGDLEDIRTDEEADIDNGKKFIVVEESSSNRITIDGDEFDWPADAISGRVVRKLGKIPPEKHIYLERQAEADRPIADTDLVKIKKEGVEQFTSRPATWELKVQGKPIVSNSPTISVVDALTQAGFDPNAWIIILNVRGQPKRQLAVEDSVDLTTPGIEKIRLTAKDVNNGEAPAAPRSDFALQRVDEDYLDELGLRWETDQDGRWLIIHDYPLPAGYNVETGTLALQIMPTYPQAQIDMFYVYPELQRSAGGIIPATQSKKTIRGQVFQRWSRHRGPGSAWNPRQDNVVTHLALVDGALAKEVGA